MSTTLNLPYRRYVRQVSRGSLGNKSSFIAMEEANLVRLKNAEWKIADAKSNVTTVTNSVMATDGKFTTYINDKYDAFKQDGDGVTTTAEMCAYAGMVAYRFKLPSFASEADASPIDSISIPVTLDRYQRSGVKISVSLSPISVPSDDWEVIRGSAEGCVATESQPVSNVDGVKSWGFGASKVGYLLAATARNETKVFSGADGAPLFTADQVFANKYIYVYLSVEDYTDFWTVYDSKGTARAYNIEGSAMIVGTGVAADFTKDGVAMPEDDGEEGKSPVGKIAAGLGVLIAAGTSVVIGVSSPSFPDADGDLMPDAWEEGFAGLSASTNNIGFFREGDVMAYAEVVKDMVVLSNSTDGAKSRLCAIDSKTAAGDWLEAGTPVWDLVEYGTNTFALSRTRSLSERNFVNQVIPSVKLIAVHATVYALFGFNANTANPTVQNSRRVHTKDFTALDKYLVARWLAGFGLCDETNMIAQATFGRYTLIPGNPDCNTDGIPDGWELYTMFKPNAQIPSSIDQVEVSPFARIKNVDAASYVRNSAYSPEGVGGLSWLGKYNEGFAMDPWSTDSDGDGIADKTAHAYGMAGDRFRIDSDNDGLSNFAEYMVATSQIPSSISSFSMFSCVDGQKVPDYFHKHGKTYLGFEFSDHDMMEDWWEDKFATLIGKPFISRFAFDMYGDEDGDGWSNWAECRAGTSPSIPYRAIDFGGEDGVIVIPECPCPVVPITLTYNGGKHILDKKVVVNAWRVGDVNSVVTNVIGSATNISYSSSKEYFSGSPNAAWVIDPSAERKCVKYIGNNFGKEKTVYLGPGLIAHGGVRILFKDPHETRGGKVQTLETAKWTEYVKDVPRSEQSTVGDLVTMSESGIDETVGWIDYSTGETRIDFSLLGGTIEFSGETNKVDLSSSFVKMTWETRPFAFGKRTDLYLTDIASDTSMSHGMLVEGRYVFTAWVCDSDETNEISSVQFRCGYPFGVRGDVGIGFVKTDNVEIDLTPCNSSVPRMELVNMIMAQARGKGDFDVLDSMTDRGVNGIGGWCWPNFATAWEGTNMPANLASVRVRFMRSLINGISNESFNECVFDQVYNLYSHASLTEADLLATGAFDLDWNGVFVDRGLSPARITNVTYRIVIGDGTTSGTELNNILGVAFQNRFEYGSQQSPAVPFGSNTVYKTARPTFQWKHVAKTARVKAYPAFQLRIWDSATATTPIYDSGVQRAPAMDANEVYSWTAPFSPDMVTSTGFVPAAGTTYYWSVSMLDAKFTTPNATETRVPFSFATEHSEAGGKSDFGAIDVAVKYFGPNDVLESNVVVQAFSSSDFIGGYVGASSVAQDNKAEMSNEVSVVANTSVKSLPVGHEYYILAFIDSNGNRIREPWESWGYANYVGDEARADIYSPRPILVKGKENATFVKPFAVIYIEDMDTDNDSLPDAYEYIKFGGLDKKRGPIAKIGVFPMVNPNLENE